MIPGPFITSVEKGVRTQMQKGVSAGFPVVDIKVTLIGGKTHSVDSSDAAFQAAGALALREAAAATRIQLLEPVSAVTISVSDDYVGAVMSDLSSRRGRLTGTSSVGGRRHRNQCRSSGPGAVAVRDRVAGADRGQRPVPPELPAARTGAPHRRPSCPKDLEIDPAPPRRSS